MNYMPNASKSHSAERRAERRVQGHPLRAGNFLLLFAFALLGVMPLNACQSAKAQGGWEKTEITTSAVCGTCKKTLEKAFQDVEGVQWARLDVDEKVMTIKHDPETIDVDGLREVIVKTGYDADGLKGDPVAHDDLPLCCQKDSGMH